MSDDEKFLRASKLFFDNESVECGPADLVANLNDTFGWACADAETVKPKDVPEVARLVRKYGRCGLLYWVSEKRGGDRSEFKDINRFIEFVRIEEQFRRDEPNSTKRAYKELSYSLGGVK